MHGTFYSRRDEVHGIGKGNDDINGVVWEDHGAIDQKANESPIAPVKMRVSYIWPVTFKRPDPKPTARAMRGPRTPFGEDGFLCFAPAYPSAEPNLTALFADCNPLWITVRMDAPTELHNRIQIM